jgi:protein-L-isoaspartate(D-aspartate) O-methyltransferase
MNQLPDFERLRHQMVREQLENRRITNKRVLETMRQIPRHLFVPEADQIIAYDDRPVAIGERQTISQPYMVALMTQLLNLKGGERVLEIGTGSGYQTAILASLAKEVYSIERHEKLAEGAQAILKNLKLKNVKLKTGDGSGGWPEYAPYNGVIVTAAAPLVPDPILEQVVEGGCLVIPVGDSRGQYLQRWERHGTGFTYDSIVPVSFVPLRGEFGWEETDWERS